MDLALGVVSPSQKDRSQTSLEVVSLIVLRHQRHHLATLRQSLVSFILSGSRDSHKLGLLALEIDFLSFLDEADVVHFIFELGNMIFLLVDTSLRFPVHHHSHQVLATRLEHVVNGALNDRLLVLVRPVMLFPHLESARRALVVGPREVIRHVTLAHALQIFGQHRVASRLVSMPLRQTSKGVILDSHLVGEPALRLETTLNHHSVPTVHPDSEGSLLHPVVHLSEQNFPVTLRSHLLLVELLDLFEALLHAAHVEGFLELVTAAFVPLAQLLTGTPCLVKVETLAEESVPHLL